MAFKSRFPLMTWSAIDEYVHQDSAYKDTARRLIEQELEFKPNLQASRSVEIGLRYSLRLRDEGKISSDQFNKELYNATLHVKRSILKNVPEQAHLVNADEAYQPFVGVR